MLKKLPAEYAKSLTLLLDPLGREGDGFGDKIYLTACVLEGADSVDINIENAPTATLNDEWRMKAGLDIPTVREISAGALPGISNVSGGTILGIDKGRQFVVLRRNMPGSRYNGFLIEPSGRCGQKPSQTMNNELDEELFVLGRFGSGFVALSFVDMYKCAAPDALIKRQAKLAAKELVARGINPAQVAAQPVVPVVMRWNQMDYKSTKLVTVRSGNYFIEKFNALAWFDRENNTMELRRSMIADLSHKEIASGDVMIADGDGYGRDVLIGDRDSLRRDKCTPFLAHYLATSITL